MMCGGRLAGGKKVNDAFLHEHSTVGSSTGSSDDPGDEHQQPVETDTVQGFEAYPDSRTPTSVTPTSTTSGSAKRRSDEGSLSRRDKIKKRITAQGKAVAMVEKIGTNILAHQEQIISMTQGGMKFQQTKMEKMERAMEKLFTLDLPSNMLVAVEGMLEKDHHLHFFLKAPRDAIVAWIQANLPAPPAPPAPPQPAYFPAPAPPPHAPYFPAPPAPPGTSEAAYVNHAFSYFGLNPNPPPN